MKKSDRVERTGVGERGREEDKGNPRSRRVVASPKCIFSPSPSLRLCPAQLAAACGITLIYEKLPLAFGRVVYLAEASLQPPRITVNTTAIAILAECAAQVPAEQRPWFTATAIAEVAVAHELYHVLTQQASSPAVEAQAHEFAQAFVGLPFSTRVYEELLKQAVRCWNTTNIT